MKVRLFFTETKSLAKLIENKNETKLSIGNYSILLTFKDFVLCTNNNTINNLKKNRVQPETTADSPSKKYDAPLLLLVYPLPNPYLIDVQSWGEKGKHPY